MTDIPLHVAAFDHGILRVWAIDEGMQVGAVLVTALTSEPRNAGPVMKALGAERVDPYWVDLVTMKDIADLGLGGYLAEAYDIPADQLAAANLATDAPHVVIVPSRAFADHEQTLSPDAAMIPLAVFDIHEDVGALRRMEPAHGKRTKGATGAPTTETGAPSGRGLRPGAILLLLVIAAAFIAMAVL